ncbi:GcrA family cell cycle regulator [Ancylobacter sp. WKF20]|uniref:GcrA family cell cycle regulator n=1 Tax=Ancylobacter sp. WKF20 TaxID=3039801 RepID=UPI0024345306|nr:GcrA family cell cycle regulator [Ancylobacter sp. WKF20]WGD31231.1 GcrA family cell cycle regulator [Ancylobacter sp. WKF20]
MRAPFSPEEDTRLKALRDEGLSASEIAVRLVAEGFPKRSRNSLCGRIHRLGLTSKTGKHMRRGLPGEEGRARGKVNKAAAPGRADPVVTRTAAEVKRLAGRARDLRMTNLAAEIERASSDPGEVLTEAAAAKARFADCLAPTPASLPTPLDLRRGIPFLGAPNEACRFPLWADDARPSVEAMRICGAPVRPGRPYCPACCALAYVPADPRRERARKAAQDERTARRRTQAWSAA